MSDYEKIIVYIFLNSLSLLMGQDKSTPKDGNLFINNKSPFHPNKMEIYNDRQILTKKNIRLSKNRIYKNISMPVKIDSPKKTSGSDIVWINDNSYVVLTGNGKNYKHGILGDKIESTGFEVYRNGKLISKYQLQDHSVFETLRPLIAELIPENPGKEIILTTSNNEVGARVQVYSQTGLLLGQSPPIGRGFRWLHVLGAASFDNSSRKYIAIVKTPHINGILELLYWNGSSLETAVSLRGNLSTHQSGSTNLNMALLMNMDSTKDSELLIPSSDFRSLLVIKYKKNELKIIKRFKLPAKIVTNFYYEEGMIPAVWIGLSNGSLVKIIE